MKIVQLTGFYAAAKNYNLSITTKTVTANTVSETFYIDSMSAPSALTP